MTDPSLVYDGERLFDVSDSISVPDPRSYIEDLTSPGIRSATEGVRYLQGMDMVFEPRAVAIRVHW